MAADNTGPENLADVLARLFTSRGWGRKSERVRLETAWAEAVGPELAPATRVGAFRRGVLEVEVRSAVLKHELEQFHKRRLLADLRARLAGVTLADLKFRAGAW
jgi:predicted nucleic acid-binding Zn ribbon protein